MCSPEHLVIDAHVHLWDEAHTPQSWMTPDSDAIARPFGPDDLKPLLDDGRLDDWERQLRACAAMPNVYAKLSGLNTATGCASWAAGDFSRVAEIALDAFGPDRLVCGSDWPIALLNGDYDRVWGATRVVVHSAAHEHEDALLGGTAARVYGVSP
jgi:L-fuconolactonase